VTGLALIIRIVSSSSVCATTNSRRWADIPMVRNRRSDFEWSPSGNVVESGSSKTVPASRKSTPCFSTFAVALPGSHANTTQPVYPLAGADWAEHDGDGGVHLVQPAATARGESGLASCAAGESSSGDKRVTIGSGSQRTLADASPGVIRKTWGQRSPATPSGLVKAHS